MRADEHLRMAQFEDHYWWFVGRKQILRSLLAQHVGANPARRVLDVGCGSGGVLDLLADYGRVTGLDPFPGPLHMARSRGHRRLLAADAQRLPLADATFGLVTALDVLEHVADDRAAVRDVARLLQPGGWFLVAVPAYRFLWSEHDEALSHFRRYVAGEVDTLLRGAGLEVVRLSYAITLLLPVVTVLRLAQRVLPQPPHQARSGLMELPPLLNAACRATLEWEAAWLRRANLPAGVSVLALARKPDSGAAAAGPGEAHDLSIPA